MTDDSQNINQRGWLKKRGNRVKKWSDRYFILHGEFISYFIKEGDVEPKGQYQLIPGCEVSEIRTEMIKKRKFSAFTIQWPVNEEEEGEEEEVEEGGEEEKKEKDEGVEDEKKGEEEEKKMNSPPPNSPSFRPNLETPQSSGKKKKKKKGGLSGWKVAGITLGGVVLGTFTAGLGLVAGAVVVGLTAAAGGGAVVLGGRDGKVRKVRGHLMLACDSRSEAKEWVREVERQISMVETRQRENGIGLSQYLSQNASFNFVGDDAETVITESLLGDWGGPPPEIHIDAVEHWTMGAGWSVGEVLFGMRLFHLVTNSNTAPPCMKSEIIVNVSPFEACMAILSPSHTQMSGVIQSTSILESKGNSDLVHLQLAPCYLWPSWTAPRDFLLMRYWRQRPDGSYLVCLDSVGHQRKCPLVPGFVRGDLHGVYLISPRKSSSPQYGGFGVGLQDSDSVDFDSSEETLITFIGELNPFGWIWKSLGYQGSFLSWFMGHMFDLRDGLNDGRFLHVKVDADEERALSLREELSQNQSPEENISRIPPPTCPLDVWSVADATTFRVRGPNYLQDRIKIQSSPSLFKLLAVDIYETDEPIFNIASHPKLRLQSAVQRGDCPDFVWVVNIMIPGPPNYAFVTYSTPNDPHFFDESRDNDPVNRIAKRFFFGDDDSFRDHRFKLIPKVIDGNMVVKMAVKDTPAILGTKLKQSYFSGPNYFEMDVDVASSSVAAGITRIAHSYSKTLVVDMGMVLQGNEEAELPEHLIYGVRLSHIDLTAAQYLHPPSL